MKTIKVYFKNSLTPLKADYEKVIEDKNDEGWDEVMAQKEVIEWGTQNLVQMNDTFIPMCHVRQITIQ